MADPCEVLAPRGELTPQDLDDFAAYERTIAAGLQVFLAVGQALTAIRDRKLYRRQYGTFESYCEQRWGLKQSRAYQLMSAADVVRHIQESSTIVELPANEGQTRALSKVWHEDQGTVWTEAVRTAPAGKVTARHIGHVVEQHQQREREAAVVARPKREPAPTVALIEYDYLSGEPMTDEDPEDRHTQTVDDIRDKLMDIVMGLQDDHLSDAWEALAPIWEQYEGHESETAALNAMVERIGLEQETGGGLVDEWPGEDWPDEPDDWQGTVPEWRNHLTRQHNARRAGIAQAHRDGACEDECPFYH